MPDPEVEYISMLTHVIEVLPRQLWNLLARCVRPRRQRKASAAGQQAADDVSRGTIVRSSFAPSDGDGPQPTDLRLSMEEKRRHVYLLGSTGASKTNLQILRNAGGTQGLVSQHLLHSEVHHDAEPAPRDAVLTERREGERRDDLGGVLEHCPGLDHADVEIRKRANARWSKAPRNGVV
jgi:hypothetical protein